MALFTRKKKNEASAQKQPAAEEQQPERRIQQATLSSGRMASVFLRLYRWIFSVSITSDSYQIESGQDVCGEDALPIRGYYHELLERLAAFVIPEQKDAFLDRFSPASIRRVSQEGGSMISGLFCAGFDPSASDDGDATEAEPAQPAEAPLRWYEVRAELLRDNRPGSLLFILYFRNIRDDMDNGRPASTGVNLAAAETREEWDEIRAKRLLGDSDTITFEYDVGNDTMYVHRGHGADQNDRTTQHFLSVLNSRSDWLVGHDSVDAVRRLLRTEPGRGVDFGEILYRSGGTFGAPFRHYRLTTVPLEEDGPPTWILGMLEDVEETSQLMRQNEEITMELGHILDMYKITLYEIRTQSNQLFPIIQGENGFRRSDKPRNLRDYITRCIENGTIAPESAHFYSDWLTPAKLSKNTARGIWEYESQLRNPGSTEYRWYSESILPLGKTGGRYIRWRSDVTDAHEARDKEYRLKEMTHLAEYNGAMLDSMAGLVEFRNVESSHHIRNVRELTRLLIADIMRRSPQYEMTPRLAALYVQASSMHDIGKITIPDSVLNKAGKFTQEEYEQMKLHTVNGAIIVDRLDMPGQDELKAIVRDVALHHHERYDGSGYPDGLVGDQIPIGVQTVSLADVFDALVSERCYKESFPAEKAMSMIFGGECGEFNPALLESLKACKDQLCAIYNLQTGDKNG